LAGQLQFTSFLKAVLHAAQHPIPASLRGLSFVVLHCKVRTTTRHYGSAQLQPARSFQICSAGSTASSSLQHHPQTKQPSYSAKHTADRVRGGSPTSSDPTAHTFQSQGCQGCPCFAMVRQTSTPGLCSAGSSLTPCGTGSRLTRCPWHNCPAGRTTAWLLAVHSQPQKAPGHRPGAEQKHRQHHRG
jgi:hypothetical protein